MVAIAVCVGKIKDNRTVHVNWRLNNEHQLLNLCANGYVLNSNVHNEYYYTPCT